MKRPLPLLGCMAALLLAACTSEEPLAPKSNQNYAERNHVSIQEAVQRAGKMLDALDAGKGMTRSGSKHRIVLDVECVRAGAKTRGSSELNIPDTLYYIINYANNGGFAVVSADNRAVPIYAVSDEGSCSLEDTVFYKGLADFFRMMENDLMVSFRGTDPVPIDTTVLDPPEELYQPIVEKVDPWIDPNVAIWHQDAPFNRFCYNSSNEQCYVGCAAIGVGQILTFYRHPSGYNGHEYNWDEIISSNSSLSLAHMLRDLGNEENLDMEYGPNESGASPGNIARTFYNMGYKELKNRVVFDRTKAMSALKNGPILVVGYGHNGKGDFIGHIWVCDGYYVYLKDVSYFPKQQMFPLFHCIWGWGGTNNGYFYFNNKFDLNYPDKVDFPQDSTPKSVFDSGINFWSDFEIRN